ncbi:hypothetical protein KCU81_g896, partial [Aureobasidium melanogenum]|uniref:Uncharacterized protein n=1 Tax=Aureobasidium melanogenum (strain CBS 110374) TaxID=1043003 RepID=A0A074W1B4_AURM1
MNPPYRSRVSEHTTDMPPVQRILKRNNVSTDVLRTDEEEREFKRNRASSYDGAYSRYARAPQDQYQQRTTQHNDDLFGPDPYAVYSPLYESPRQPTPVRLLNENAQHSTRTRQQDIVPGLGNSILDRRPFQEESDSSEDGSHVEDFGQPTDIKYETPPPFVQSREGTRTSQTGQRYGHDEADDNRFRRGASHLQRNGREAYLQPPLQAQIQNPRSNSRYAYNTLPHQPPPSGFAPSRHVSFDLPDGPRQHASDHERARISHAAPREHAIHTNRQRPEIPTADRAKQQRRRQSQPGAQDTREPSRAHYRNEPTGAQHDVAVASSQTLNTSHHAQYAQHQERANHHSRSQGAESTPAPDTRPKKSTVPAGFVKQKNILSSIRSKKPRQPFQEDLDYPPPVLTSSPFDQKAPVPQPAGQQYVSPPVLTQASSQHHVSPPVSSHAFKESSSLASKIPKEQLLKFQPDATDIRVWDYMNRKDNPMNWSQVKEILDLTRTPYVLETLKSRQRLYQAKRALEPPKKETTPKEEEAPEQDIIPLEDQYFEQPASSATTRPVLAKPIVQAPPVRLPDAKRLADQLEQERLAWATKEAELQQHIKTIEEESAAKTAELKEQEKQLKLKAEVQEKYQKLKEEAQTHRESLRDEKALRAKAERDLKAAISDAHKRSLAQAGAARKAGKVTDTGFAFSNDGEDVEGGDEGQKKTPSKRSKSRKSTEISDIREDGYPRTAGKSLPPAAIQALYKHLNSCKDEEEEVDEEPPEVIQEADLTYFVYTVCRKQWLNSEEEPDDDIAIACGDYTYLNAANAAVTNEILRPHGTASAIKIDPKRERSLHQGMSEHDMAWAQLDVPEGHVKVWVQRQLHTEFVGELPLFEDKGILSKTVFAVRQETSTPAALTSHETPAAPIATTVLEEDSEIYTTFDLANLKANEKVFKLLWPEENQSMRIHDINAKEEARRQRKQTLEDLEDHGQLFSEEIQREDGTSIKVWVVQKTVVGPRN